MRKGTRRQVTLSIVVFSIASMVSSHRRRWSPDERTPRRPRRLHAGRNRRTRHGVELMRQPRGRPGRSPMSMNRADIDRFENAVAKSLHDHWVAFLIEG